MKNFGLSELVLVAPERELNQAAFNLATHAKDVLESARVVASTAEAVAGCTLVLGTTARARRSEAYDIFTPRDAAQTFPREGLGLMFGPEAAGLSNEDLDYCQALVRIPTSAFSSLNLAQAVNLIAYEFFVSQVDAGKSKQPPDLAGREALERLYRHFLDAACHIGYADEANLRQTEHMYRRIFDRARLTAREVTALHGLWRQMVWAAEHGPDELRARQGDGAKHRMGFQTEP